MSPLKAATMHASEAARQHGDLRTVAGRAYPVPQDELERWILDERRRRAQRRLRLHRERRLTPQQVFY